MNFNVIVPVELPSQKKKKKMGSAIELYFVVAYINYLLKRHVEALYSSRHGKNQHTACKTNHNKREQTVNKGKYRGIYVVAEVNIYYETLVFGSSMCYVRA